MVSKTIIWAGMALLCIVTTVSVTKAMNYSSGNSLMPSELQSAQPGATTTTSFQGGGTIAAGTVMNFGGPSGLSFQGNQGIWSGARTFGAAPFSVDLSGNMKAIKGTFTGSISIPPNFSVDSGGNLIASSVTIKDGSGSNIVDSTGLVSTTQFTSGIVSIANAGGSFTTTTDLSANIPNLSITFSLARSANVFLFAQVGGGNTNVGKSADYAKFQLAVDGSLVGGAIDLYGNWYMSGTTPTQGVGQSGTPITINTLTAGSHTLTCRYATTNGTYSAFNTDQTQIIGYIVLGK